LWNGGEQFERANSFELGLAQAAAALIAGRWHRAGRITVRVATLYACRYRAKTGLNLLVGTLLGHSAVNPLI
jgi:hypothetical protein